PLGRRCGRGTEGGGQSGEREGGDEEPEVTQGDVVVVADQKQVDDDPGQPDGDEIAAEPGAESDDESCDDLDGADDIHHLMCGPRQVVHDVRREIPVPVDEHVEVLVEPEGDGCDGEGHPQ